MGAARTAIGLLAAVAATAFACTAVRADELTLYSTREANLVEPVIAAFTAATGTKVRSVFVEDSLVKRLTSEGNDSPADVLITIGLDKTTQLVTHGLTQPLASSVLDRAVPANLRGGGGQWIALAVRPRVVLTRNDSSLAAIDYEELSDPKWRGKLCMRPAAHQNNVALIAAYLAHHGTDATESWLAGLKDNLAHKPTGKDNDVVREIAQGRCEIGIGNTVALAQLRDGREGNNWRGWADAVKAVPTAFTGGGSHVNLTGAAMARHAPHPAAARAFLEFLVTPAAQTIFAAAELEYPVLATARRAPIVEGIGSFAADALPVDEIAAHQAAAVTLIRKAGFDE
ncbi:extracellular solute-binding protein [Bradyrhizobium tropiciagri]|uniref:extracellular solute-binding protein n=1 Tax=Bradyrhizobium tropiciagri TaxID=312253 RepID=UPI00067B6291|nr:extracellular solute-binding protein [Bradyrhizobium tropiciagri]